MSAIVRLGLLAGLIALGSCSRYVKVSQVEANIKADIERQGRRLALKAVICPKRVAKQAEAYFRCVGELPDGGQFTINVTQQDDQGTVAWDVPSSKVLINLASLEEKIQDDIGEALGKRLAIDCRDTYRANQRSDLFECDVVGAGTVATGRVESVLVKVNGDGNLEWQEVVVGSTVVPAPIPPDSATPTSGAKAAAQPVDNTTAGTITTTAPETDETGPADAALIEDVGDNAGDDRQ